jgi:hypothetical protein
LEVFERYGKVILDPEAERVPLYRQICPGRDQEVIEEG